MAQTLVLNRKRQVPAEDTPAFGGIAERFRRAGDLDRAVELCQDGLRKFPDHLSARVTLGWAMLDLGRYDEAREALESALKRAPDNLAAIRGLAELHDRAEHTMLMPMDGPGQWPPDAATIEGMDPESTSESVPADIPLRSDKPMSLDSLLARAGTGGKGKSKGKKNKNRGKDREADLAGDVETPGEEDVLADAVLEARADEMAVVADPAASVDLNALIDDIDSLDPAAPQAAGADEGPVDLGLEADSDIEQAIQQAQAAARVAEEQAAAESAARASAAKEAAAHAQAQAVAQARAEEQAAAQTAARAAAEKQAAAHAAAQAAALAKAQEQAAAQAAAHAAAQAAAKEQAAAQAAALAAAEKHAAAQAAAVRAAEERAAAESSARAAAEERAEAEAAARAAAEQQAVAQAAARASADQAAARAAAERAAQEAAARAVAERASAEALRRAAAAEEAARTAAKQAAAESAKRAAAEQAAAEAVNRAAAAEAAARVVAERAAAEAAARAAADRAAAEAAARAEEERAAAEAAGPPFVLTNPTIEDFPDPALELLTAELAELEEAEAAAEAGPSELPLLAALAAEIEPAGQVERGPVFELTNPAVEDFPDPDFEHLAAELAALDAAEAAPPSDLPLLSAFVNAPAPISVVVPVRSVEPQRGPIVDLIARGATPRQALPALEGLLKRVESRRVKLMSESVV